jgi:hypothetical protein
MDRSRFQAAWARASVRNGALCDNLLRELEELSERGEPRVPREALPWLFKRAIAVRAYHLALTPPCDHGARPRAIYVTPEAARDPWFARFMAERSSAGACPQCSWLDPAWCLMVALCAPPDYVRTARLELDAADVLALEARHASKLRRRAQRTARRRARNRTRRRGLAPRARRAFYRLVWWGLER